MFTPPKKVR